MFANILWVVGMAHAFVLLLMACALGEELPVKARRSVVYIYFDVTDATNGGKTSYYGTGFIVTPSGYVLSASHLFRTWKKQSDVDRVNNSIRATRHDLPGFTTESPLILALLTSEILMLKTLPCSSCPNRLASLT